MSLNDSIRANHPEYSALRADLRARARDWVDIATPKTATNARRQLNQAFDAGVSATIELLRDRAPSSGLSAEEWETIQALREGRALIVPANKSTTEQFGVGVYPSGYGVEEGDRSGVRVASGAPNVEATPRGGSLGSGEENERAEPADAAYDVDGEVLLIEDRVIWTEHPELGPGSIQFISANRRRCKWRADSNQAVYESIPACFHRLDGAR